jgi:predicted metallopeptidase
MDWQLAPELQKRVEKLSHSLHFTHLDPKRIIVFRSYGSVSRARARIWSLPRIWQKALKVSPHYCLEVLSERFDHLSREDQDRILIHELLHIPKTFSGALLPHRGRKRRIDNQTIDSLYRALRKGKNDHYSR